MPVLSQSSKSASAALLACELGADADSELSMIGAKPSNTAPANYNNSSSTAVLLSGIDSLYLSFPGNIHNQLDDRLKVLKEFAQSEDARERSEAHLQIGNHDFEVMPAGKRLFPYVLADNWFNFKVSSAQSLALPLAHCQIRSQLLTRCGHRAAFSEAEKIAGSLGQEGGATVSRVDLFVDFTTEFCFESLHDRCWVTRASSIARYSSARRFTGFSIGKRGTISCRLYDKSLEIQQSQKTYLLDHWRKSGDWDGRLPVWRLEFQIDRTMLSQLGLTAFPDVEARLNSLWSYATKKWLKLCLPTEDSNQSRWPVESVWDTLSRSTFNDEPLEALSRVARTRVPGDPYLYRNGIAVLSSFMAKNGITDLHEGWRRYLIEAARFHRDSNDSYGRGLEDYLIPRVLEKATRYNTQGLRPDPYRTQVDEVGDISGEL